MEIGKNRQSHGSDQNINDRSHKSQLTAQHRTHQGHSKKLDGDRNT